MLEADFDVWTCECVHMQSHASPERARLLLRKILQQALILIV